MTDRTVGAESPTVGRELLLLLREERVESGCATEAGSAGATSVTSGSACVTRISGVTSITRTAGSTSSAGKPGRTQVEVSRFGVVVDVCDVGTKVAAEDCLDGRVVFDLVARVDRVAAELVFAVFSEDVAQVESSPLNRSGDGAESLNVFIAHTSASGEVTVPGLLEDLLEVAVVIVSAGVLERSRYQRELSSLAVVGIAAVEVPIDDIRHVAHLLGALDTLTGVELGAVAFDDSSTLSGYRGFRISGRNLVSIDVTVLVYRVDVGLKTCVVGKAWLKSLRSAAAVTAAAATNRCAAAVAAATANLGYLLSAAAGESAPALGHLLHRLHERLQHKHHLCLLRVKTETLLGSAECGCSERSRKLVDERILSGVKTALDKCHGLLPLVTFLCL